MDIELGEFYARLGTIALIIALGFLLGKLKWISDKTNGQIVNLLLMVFMPAALFTAFPNTYSEESLNMFLAGMAGGALVLLALIVVAKVVFNKWFYKGEIGYESQFALVFNNATFLGYPIIATTFGQAGLVPYSGFIIAFNIALFSYGVFLFERKLSWRLVRDTVLNPNIIAVLLGMLVFLVGIQVPNVIADGATLVGSAMTPLSLICIGFILSHAKFLTLIRKWRLFLTAVIQLVLGPTVTYFLLVGLNFPTEVVIICTLIQALPTATSLALFAKKYGGNEIESSELVAVSTLMSVITLPIIISLYLV
ncbi:AEC family transporter [Candidatus Saccharibacteria bacterium]|nr:AEC family transporter [Candidatus Saccharibacteria bacterium]